VRFRFGDYALDTDTRELKRGPELIYLAPKVFDLLAYLVQNRERVATRDDLLKFVWSGRIVSDSTLTSHINAVRKAIGDSGGEQQLVRTVPRKGFRFVAEVVEQHSVDLHSSTRLAIASPLDKKGNSSPTGRSENAAGQNESNSIPARDGRSSAELERSTLSSTGSAKPSIAVLPFHNLTGDPEQEYFADGVVEEIIIALSRNPWLIVMARNSSFTYKGHATDLKQVAQELSVRYILEGSVRRASNRVRIAGQLIDTSTGAHIWADRFDGTLDDIFDLQDQITASVVGAMSPKLERAEIERVKRKPTESLDAYDCYLRGMASFNQRTRKAVNEALRLFYKAIELDPDYASAYGMAAWCYGWRKINGWVEDRSLEIAETRRLGRCAAELGPDDAVALSRGGHALAFVAGDLDDAAVFFDRALVLNPNLVGAWYASGWGRIWLGEPDLAIKQFAHAMRLSPLDPQIITMQAGTAFAHFLTGRYDEALFWAKKARWEQTNYVTPMRLAAASYALMGRLAEAQKIMTRLRELDPSLRVSNIRDWVPLRRPEDLARLEDGLRKAGLPE
jgi:TolB-like protein/DNA-binding winged helix-turn-helix (wHTH) protein